jgi:hypothetical protein
VTDLSQRAEQLANRIAELLDSYPLDVAATALAMNLASVIAGYGHRGRDSAERQITTLLRLRVQQLFDAGEAADSTEQTL